MIEYTLKIAAGETKLLKIDAQSIYFKKAIMPSSLTVTVKRDQEAPMGIEQGLGTKFPESALEWHFEATGAGAAVIIIQFYHPGESPIDNRPQTEKTPEPSRVGSVLWLPSGSGETQDVGAADTDFQIAGYIVKTSIPVDVYIRDESGAGFQGHHGEAAAGTPYHVKNWSGALRCISTAAGVVTITPYGF